MHIKQMTVRIIDQIALKIKTALGVHRQNK